MPGMPIHFLTEIWHGVSFELVFRIIFTLLYVESIGGITIFDHQGGAPTAYYLLVLILSIIEYAELNNHIEMVVRSLLWNPIDVSG